MIAEINIISINKLNAFSAIIKKSFSFKSISLYC